jgi:AcrR family transcriptional regulator
MDTAVRRKQDDARRGPAARRDAPPRRLGRRPGERETRNEILNAAEKAFARDGYDNTSLRQIATRARVNAALVQYYFGSKEGLFRAMFVRRGQELAAERLALFDALEARARQPTLEDIVHAYLRPAFNLMQRGAGGVAFMRLQARLQNDPGELSLTLRTSVYEEPMQRFLRTLRAALPRCPADVLYWRVTFMVGAYLHAISDANRLHVISGGRWSAKDREEAFRQLMQFFVAGLRAAAPA